MTETQKPDENPQQKAAPARKAPAKPDVPAVGDVVLHTTVNRARDNQAEDQALVVIGHQDVRLVPADPNDERRETHLLAVPLGWVKDLFHVPKTAPVPTVLSGAYAQLRPGEYTPV